MAERCLAARRALRRWIGSQAVDVVILDGCFRSFEVGQHDAVYPALQNPSRTGQEIAQCALYAIDPQIFIVLDRHYQWHRREVLL
jgi:hypothetical protein